MRNGAEEAGGAEEKLRLVLTDVGAAVGVLRVRQRAGAGLGQQVRPQGAKRQQRAQQLVARLHGQKCPGSSLGGVYL